jgi:hypothetical protein
MVAGSAQTFDIRYPGLEDATRSSVRGRVNEYDVEALLLRGHRATQVRPDDRSNR